MSSPTRISTQVDKEAWESEFILLPPGDYVGVHEMPKPETSKKGNPMLNFRIKIELPETVTVEGKEHRITNQRIFDQVALVPKAAGILRQKLAGSGVSFNLVGDQVDFDYAEFQGKRVKVSIGVEEDPESGKKRNRVNKITPAA